MDGNLAKPTKKWPVEFDDFDDLPITNADSKDHYVGIEGLWSVANFLEIMFQTHTYY
jgi:hypothetical protein